MAEAVEVSVIIPTRDRWSLLETSALPAAFSQRDVELEVIVIDDGSIDGTAERVARLGDSRVRVHRLARSAGVSSARNAGIWIARGEWLAFLDDDDVWSPHKLRAQIDAASATGAGFAYSAAVVTDEDRRVIDFQPSPDLETLARELPRENVVPGGCSNVVARRELVDRLGGFDLRLAIFADWDLWLRLSRITNAVPCTDVHVGYLQHARGMVVSDADRLLDELDYLAAKHGDPATGRSAVDGLAAMRWAVYANKRAGHRSRAAGFAFRGGIRYRSRPDVVRGFLVLARGLIPSALARALFRARDAILEVVTRTSAEPTPVFPEPEWLETYEPAPAGPAVPVG